MLDQSHLFKLLKDDGVYFYHDSARIYDHTSQVFRRITKEFSYDLSQPPPAHSTQSADEPFHDIVLWVQGISKPLKNKVKSLHHRVRRLEKQLEKVINLPFLSHDVQQASTALNSNSNEEVHEMNKLITQPLLEHYPSLAATLPQSSTAFSELHSNKQRLDIAIMYAEPLVKKEGFGILSLPDAVDYEEECNQIVEIVERKELGINLVIEIATRENLINLLSRSPTVLHIICHGEYDSKREEFFLCFENEEGQLDPIYQSDLQAIPEILRKKVQLVFVNACHSEQVARVFEAAGVPCVIAVQSQLQIADHTARKFAQEFYSYLFDGFTLGEAFDNAQLASKSTNSLSCCCAHSHKPDCRWYKKAISEGYYKAHLFHDPCCTGCPKKQQHLHNYDCNWANEYLSEIVPEEVENLDERRFDFETMEVRTCCCSPELTHDESMKFLKLLQKQCQETGQASIVQ